MEDDLILFDRLNIIRDVVNKYGQENFYISFSGGKDSTVLHYLVDEALPETIYLEYLLILELNTLTSLNMLNK